MKEAQEKDPEFVPFGPEWVREMQKLPKAVLIEMLRDALIKLQVDQNIFDAMDVK